MVDTFESSVIFLPGKQPGEKIKYSVSLTPWLADGETGDSIAGSITPSPSGITVESSPAPAINSNNLEFTVSGGVSLQVYYLTATINTSASRIIMMTMHVYVRSATE